MLKMISEKQREVAALREYGTAFKDIGEMLGISTSAARQRFQQYEIKMREINIKKDYLNGMTIDEIAIKYDVSKNLTLRKLKGVVREDKTALKEENERLKLNIQHALQYVHDETLKGHLTDEFADYIHQLLTQK